MPIGIRRINDPHPQPSSQIIFIKPLVNKSDPKAQAYAQDFLERIAAICHPIMKANHLSIMTLEEHEPNREFVGRNFNAGEIIQLVLRSHRTGQWLSFRTVQMVMIHELAHCMQMNHSRAFWAVRNGYAGELRELWNKSYTGDGMWGRGRTMLSGEYDGGRLSDEPNVLPEQLCGGVYRRYRRRKRKRGVKTEGDQPAESWAERKQRRIKKKFGVNGQALGGDEQTRVGLEYGQKVKGNPRVANSSRGRELRVAAALARFGQQQKTEDGIGATADPSRQSSEQIEDDDSETTDEEIEDDFKPGSSTTTNLSDQNGDLVKVCGDQDANDSFVKQEMDELKSIDRQSLVSSSPGPPEETGSGLSTSKTKPQNDEVPEDSPSSAMLVVEPDADNRYLRSSGTCRACSMKNEAGSTVCQACSNVLDTNIVRDHWKCNSETCHQSSTEYVNPGDTGICGVCGSVRRP